MKKSTTTKMASLVLSLGMILSSCVGADKNKPMPKDPEEGGKAGTLEVFKQGLDAYTASLPSVPQRAPFAERLVPTGSPQSMMSVGSTLRATEEGTLYEQAKEFEKQLLFSDNENVFYPGALLDAESVVRGDYDPINLTEYRNPITVSTSLQGEGSRSVVINRPSLSGVREGVNELLNRTFVAPPARTTFTIEEVYSKSHLNIALGANYKGTTASVEGSAKFDYENEYNRFIVKVEQVFFDLSLDEPANVSDFFKSEFDYKSKFGKVRPLYVSSVKYGRVLLLTIETKMSKVEAESKLKAAFLSDKLGVNAELAFQQLNKESKINGRVIGGDASLGNLVTVDINKVRDFMEKGGRLSKDNPGAPIAYTLKELGNNKVFKTVIYSQYPKKDPFAGRFSQISFNLVAPNRATTVSGERLSELGNWHLKIGNGPETKLGGFDYHYGNFIHDIPSYKSGDKMTLYLKVENGSYKGKKYTFEMPVFEELAREGEKAEKEGRNPVFHEERNPLTVRDTTGTIVIKLGVQSLKLLK